MLLWLTIGTYYPRNCTSTIKHPWGTAKEPNCASLTAEQLSKLNFDTPYAQSKLSEVLAEVQATAQEKFERVQQAVGSVNVPEKIEALEKRQAEFEKSKAEIE